MMTLSSMNFKKVFLAFLLLSSMGVLTASTSKRGDSDYSSNDVQRSPLVGHLIPHSHCDPGYKKTELEYYETEVRHVISSVMDSLRNDNHGKGRSSMNRRFVWSETSFFSRWWSDERTTDLDRESFVKFLEEGKVELVNGGWVMHDEGVTRYDSQIRQMTYGHDHLNRILNLTTDTAPVTGWQIDPFGTAAHSVNFFQWSEMPFLIHNRVPPHLKEEMMASQSLEFIWETDMGSSMLVHVLDHHYETPVGFNWEDPKSPPAPITRKNVAEQSDKFMEYVRERSDYFLTPNVLIPFGGDFLFVNASSEFDNMDQIIEFVNSNPDRYNGDSLRYTTAKEYRNALVESVGPDRRMDEVFPVITGSPFLPYWTGYYTQLPILKQMVRSCELLLGAIQNQLLNGLTREDGWESTMGSLLPSDWEALDGARDRIGLMQHHDAITATSYRFVLADYQKYLIKTFKAMTDVFTKLVLEHAGEDGANGLIVGGGPYLHETILVRDSDSSRSIHVDRIVDAQMGRPPVDLLVVNSLSWEVDTVVSFISTRSDVAIMEHSESGSKAIVSQATPMEYEIESSNLGLFLISFRTNLESFSKKHYSVHTCYLTYSTGQRNFHVLPGLECAEQAKKIGDDSLLKDGLSTDSVHVHFDRETHDLSQITRTFEDGSEATSSVRHDVVLYNGNHDTIYDMQTSVEDSDPPLLFGTAQRKIVSTYDGPLFSQVTLQLNSWISVRYKVYKGGKSIGSLNNLLEISMLAGPRIPKSINLASRFQTDMGGDSSWYYDENGFMPVKAEYDPSFGAGYSVRPLITRTWLQPSDENIDSSSKVLTFSSVDPRGVLYRGDGDIDIMWKRRNDKTSNDFLGPQDWLKEGEDLSVSRSSIWLSLDRPDSNGAQSFEARRLATELANDVVLLRTSVVPTAAVQTRSTFAQGLPDELHVVSATICESKLLGDMETGISTPCKAGELWIDIHLENLAEDEDTATSVELPALLSVKENAVSSEYSLHSMTYLHPYGHGAEGPETGVNTALNGHSLYGTTCEIKYDDEHNQILAVPPRQICALRITFTTTMEESRSLQLPRFAMTENTGAQSDGINYEMMKAFVIALGAAMLLFGTTWFVRMASERKIQGKTLAMKKQTSWLLLSSMLEEDSNEEEEPLRRMTSL